MTGDEQSRAEGPSIPASVDTLVRFQIGRKHDAPEDPTKPVYLLAPASTKLQLALTSAIAARGIEYPTDETMVAAIATAIDRAHMTEGLEPKVLDWYRSVIDRFMALPPLKEGERPTFDRMAVVGAIQEIEEALAAPDNRIGLLRMKRRTCGRERIRVACAIGLRGWENRSGTVEVVGVEATPATLEQLSEEDQQAIGFFWMMQRSLSEAQKKTSDSPPPSDATPTTSPSTTRARRSKGSRSARSATTLNGTKALSAIPAG